MTQAGIPSSCSSSPSASALRLTMTTRLRRVAQRSRKKRRREVPLLSLAELEPAVLLRRPSARNRSPYVADAKLESSGREVLVHVPSLDMGGKCVPGSKLLVKPARDRKGELVGASAVGKYGTPKCEFIAQLLRVDEPENAAIGGCWVGAHPSLGERLARALLEDGSLQAQLGEHTELQREVRNIAGTDMRTDFVLTRASGDKTVLEVKTVVDTDYSPRTAPERTGCVYLGSETNYRRAAIFPWGRAGQKGPEGETVVSARAIKHIDELAAIARGEKKEPGVKKLDAAVLFVCVRADAETFRANHEACPSFAAHLAKARDSGVRIMAHRVRWGEGEEQGQAFSEGSVDVEWKAAGER